MQGVPPANGFVGPRRTGGEPDCRCVCQRGLLTGAAHLRMTRINDPEKIHLLESPGSVCHGDVEANRRCAMAQLKVAEKDVAADTDRVSSAYVPTLQRTQGQPPPIAAHGGLSYMSFDR